MEKDITVNDLLSNNDVFADIANVNLFDGERVIYPDDLETVPTDSSYKDLEGKHHKLFRDTLKKVRKLGGCIAFLGYESQTAVNNVMPVRDMGYTYTAYVGQIRDMVAENNKMGHSAYARVLHDDQRLMPVATVVLYFGRREWTRPLLLMDVLEIPEKERSFWNQMLTDYKIHVVHMADQPEEVRKKYRSDFGIIADYLAYHQSKEKLGEYLRNDSRKITHVEQVLDVLQVISGDGRFQIMKEHYLECEECDSMCLLLDMCEEEGIRKGIELGIQQGIEKGMEKGIERGMQQEKIKLAKNLLDVLDISTIMLKTGLSEDAVLKLADEE